MCSSCANEVWRADLDGNGTQDYVFVGSGPYFNGRAPPLYSLTILLMDSDELPVPFFTAIYHGENGNEIRHLVDLNHQGRAQLLISDYEEAVSDPRVQPFCSGYWVTQFYEFKNLSVDEVQGRRGGRRLL